MAGFYFDPQLPEKLRMSFSNENACLAVMLTLRATTQRIAEILQTKLNHALCHVQVVEPAMAASGDIRISELTWVKPGTLPPPRAERSMPRLLSIEHRFRRADFSQAFLFPWQHFLPCVDRGEALDVTRFEGEIDEMCLRIVAWILCTMPCGAFPVITQPRIRCTVERPECAEYLAINCEMDFHIHPKCGPVLLASPEPYIKDARPEQRLQLAMVRRGYFLRATPNIGKANLSLHWCNDSSCPATHNPTEASDEFDSMVSQVFTVFLTKRSEHEHWRISYSMRRRCFDFYDMRDLGSLATNNEEDISVVTMLGYRENTLASEHLLAKAAEFIHKLTNNDEEEGK